MLFIHLKHLFICRARMSSRSASCLLALRNSWPLRIAPRDPHTTPAGTPRLRKESGCFPANSPAAAVRNLSWQIIELNHE
jgi:hypothetical protein